MGCSTSYISVCGPSSLGSWFPVWTSDFPTGHVHGMGRNSLFLIFHSERGLCLKVAVPHFNHLAVRLEGTKYRAFHSLPRCAGGLVPPSSALESPEQGL